MNIRVTKRQLVEIILALRLKQAVSSGTESTPALRQHLGRIAKQAEPLTPIEIAELCASLGSQQPSLFVG